MGKALGEILPLAIAAAIRPGTFMAVALLLTTSRARSNGLAFGLAFVASLGVISTALLVVANTTGASDAGSPSSWASVFKLVVGTVCLLMALRLWRARPKSGDAPQEPKWLAALETLTPGKALGFGALFGVVNGKTLLMTAAAAVYIAQTGIAGSEQAVVLAVYVAIAALCVLAPLAIYALAGSRAQPSLDRMAAWLIANTAAIMVTIFLLIGITLLGAGIKELA